MTATMTIKTARVGAYPEVSSVTVERGPRQTPYSVLRDHVHELMDYTAQIVIDNLYTTWTAARVTTNGGTAVVLVGTLSFGGDWPDIEEVHTQWIMQTADITALPKMAQGTPWPTPPENGGAV